MNDQNETAQLRFLEETAIRLRQNGFTVEPIEDHQLPVCWEKGRLCRITGKGSVYYRREDTDTPQAEDALFRIEDIAAKTLEYMTAMETAPRLKATGLTGDYEEYFSQQRLYDYAEDVFSGWSLQDADISYDGTVLRLTDSKGILMQDIATLKGYLFQTADKNWIYGISETSELVRVSYSGKIETLFADRTGLLRSLAEKEHAPIYLADGCTLFFLAGTDEGIGIYRLYLPNKQADVLYSSIPRNALRLRLEPPPSNVEAVWDNGDVLFFARYEELLNTSSGYVPETMGEDECIGMLELDEKLYSAQAHYINALTGDYREMPYGYVYLPMPRSKENIALNGEAWWLDV